jgi:ABC-type multidrug transport system ATPase subunit
MMTAYQLSNIQMYYQQQCVLDIPELTIAAGQKVALLGENGAGKSTLLNLLAVTHKPTQGEVKIFDQTTSFPLNKALRRRIGLVAQQPYLLHTSVKANLKLALKLQGIASQQHETLIKQALNLTHASHLVDKHASSLSGGELKRVAIARALAYQPDIVLLDEPFSHLDKRNVIQLEHILNRLTTEHNKTIIFSTHNQLQSLSIADRTINLVHGKVTKTPLLNLFHGRLRGNEFDTGNLIINVATDKEVARHITIDPTEIILSRHPLDSSLRNQLTGTVSVIAAEGETVRLVIQAQEQFQVIISKNAFIDLSIQLADAIWLSFKATAVVVF